MEILKVTDIAFVSLFDLMFFFSLYPTIHHQSDHDDAEHPH